MNHTVLMCLLVFYVLGVLASYDEDQMFVKNRLVSLLIAVGWGPIIVAAGIGTAFSLVSRAFRFTRLQHLLSWRS